MLLVNYNYQTLINIPEDLRTSDTYDWLRLQAAPLTTHNTNLDETYNAAVIEATHTMQVLSLEYFLADILNTINEIRIEDGIFLNNTILYNADEFYRTKTYLYNADEINRTKTYLYNEAEYETQSVDYYVYLSYADAGLIEQLKVYLDKFKPAGKKYEIKLY